MEQRRACSAVPHRLGVGDGANAHEAHRVVFATELFDCPPDPLQARLISCISNSISTGVASQGARRHARGIHGGSVGFATAEKGNFVCLAAIIQFGLSNPH